MRLNDFQLQQQKDTAFKCFHRGEKKDQNNVCFKSNKKQKVQHRRDVFVYSLDSRTSYCCFAGINGKGFQVNLLKSNIDVKFVVVECIGCSSVYLCCYLYAIIKISSN